jgi:ADP-dependent NAD(P)H-hydrate dehydratase / NAD(P)H-hydrate epimerase
MIKLVTVEEMRAIEKEGDSRGVSYAEMMERAGRGVALIVHERYGHIDPNNALGLVGSGNNGGDALVALAALAEMGWQVRAYLVKPRAENDELVTRVLQAGGEVIGLSDDNHFKRLGEWISAAGVILDGVLGTGVTLPLSVGLETTLSLVKSYEPLPPVIAIDCPSGVDCDSGDVSPATLTADLTICMDAIKIGLLRFPANDRVGSLTTVDLGLPEDLEALRGVNNYVATAEDIHKRMPTRYPGAHKGTFGTCVIAAGSVNFIGAALLAGEGAYRSGVGLVRMAVPEPLHVALAGSLPEATWLPLPHHKGGISADAVDVLRESLERASAFLVGPGLGSDVETEAFITRLCTTRLTMPGLVVDADGLRLLAMQDNWYNLISQPAVLTPHPGEMSAISGLSVAEIQSDRLRIARLYANRWGHVVVLKGAFTVVAAPEGVAHVIPVATAALARAGSGDVLAGLIAGLLAQGLSAFDAALCATWIHARAGQLAAQRFGQTASVLARDVLVAIPEVMARLEQKDYQSWL